MAERAAAKGRRGLLGERLVDRGSIRDEQLALALREQRRIGGHLGEILVSLGFVSEEEIASVLAQQAGVQEVNIAEIKIPPDILSLLDEAFCRKYKLLPLSADEHHIRVAMSNTFDVLAVDEVSRLSRRTVEVVATSEPAMLEALDRVFGGDETKAIEALISDASEASARPGEIGGGVSEQPIVRLVDAILREGVRLGATDIHVEPEGQLLRCRFRVDGVLVQGSTLPKSLQSAIMARIKLLADMDISETRLPQDGKIVTRIDRRHINMRVSTIPTVHGENIVVRILDRNRLALGLEELGFSKSNLAILSEAIGRPAGILLVTGPTGSGKTTTLYAALSDINSLERKIATLEDPIEYELPVIRQSQVNTRAGLTFGIGLRAVLRQDPDVILVGEMRDRETAEVALRAAMTGHLVLSTLHTSSAAGTIPRLLNMGMEPYLVASSLIGVVAQRLVRMLCTHCRVHDDQQDREKMCMFGLDPEQDYMFYRGRGCDRCSGTGFKGRRAVAEVLRVSPAIARLIAQGADSARIARTAQKEGMALMEDDARDMVLRGETSLEEAIRQTWGGDRDREIPATAGE